MNKEHLFNCNNSINIIAAVLQGLEVTFLPYFIGDTAANLQCYREPDPKFNLGLGNFPT